MAPRTDSGSSELDARHAGLGWVVAAVFLQMLPATLVAPAIRPLFASFHGGAEGPMHAFMSLSMLGGIVTTPLIARLATSGRGSAAWLSGLALADAILLVIVASPIPTKLALILRTFEGAAHLGASTLLLARAAAFKPVVGAGRAMGLAGGAVMLAIALGSGLGGVLVSWGPDVPFRVGAGVSMLTALVAPLVYSRRLAVEPQVSGVRETRPDFWSRDVMGPLSAAFVERCTVGMIIVTFALFATRFHEVSDRSVGILYSLLTLPFALLMYPASRLGDRIPRASLLAAGAILYGSSIATLAVAPTAGLAFAMLTAGVASALMYGSVLCYAATLVSPAARPRMMAWINTAGAFGMMIGPAVGGALVALVRSTDLAASPATPYRIVFFAAGFMSLLWTVLMMPWLFERYREEAGDASFRRSSVG